ncbi:S26 family signal peptidase [Bradyrhizobium sp. WYCCWR 13023]|uniref:S26 family signal peptidase n=1 Tax=Bradyrhizobium zhengyangense TaxID=2911009 RepID=A0A9X1UK13_9BRAD|nr:S26 family signal peptidase [Bradyrhizobium zhengyangense]MCG2633272.1 S26 family signal peptidase [Bradyrhizobium zhengyangense]
MTGRVKMLTTTFGAPAALIATLALEPLPLFIWNESASADRSLSLATDVTELVAVSRPSRLRPSSLNGYLPVGVPMLKRVLALPGQTVCRTDLTISVDDIVMGEARDRDGRGRPLPKWQGCRVVGDGELFVMNWQSHDTLDGRYFGFLPASAVISHALPVWKWRSDRACSTLLSRHSSVRSIAGPFLRPDQRLQGRRGPRQSRAAAWPARSGFALDGREHDGMLGSVGRTSLGCRVAAAYLRYVG